MPSRGFNQRDLAKGFNVAFTNLKLALDHLEVAGYVVRKIGQGNCAACPEEYQRIVLVVDDDQDVRDFFEGYCPTTAGTASQSFQVRTRCCSLTDTDSI